MKRYVTMCVTGVALIFAGFAIQAGKLGGRCKHGYTGSSESAPQPAAAEPGETGH